MRHGVESIHADIHAKERERVVGEGEEEVRERRSAVRTRIQLHCPL